MTSIRRATARVVSSVAYTRLQPGAAIVLISTRWHEDDLAGRLLRESGDEDWDVLSLPAIAEIDESFRRAGEALWPEKFPLEALEQIRRELAVPLGFAVPATPSAAEGAVFKRQWLRITVSGHVCKRIVQSWDTAFKTGAGERYLGLYHLGRGGKRLLPTFVWRGRARFSRTKAADGVAGLKNGNRSAILVEDKASGQSLIQELGTKPRCPSFL